MCLDMYLDRRPPEGLSKRPDIRGRQGPVGPWLRRGVALPLATIQFEFRRYTEETLGAGARVPPLYQKADLAEQKRAISKGHF